MSPLVRSLLALAALLAAADAQYNCVTKVIGQTTDYTQDLDTVDLPFGKSDLYSEDKCPYPMHKVGEKVTVCNKTPNTNAADISGDYYNIDPVYIDCKDGAGCEASVTEYCGY